MDDRVRLPQIYLIPAVKQPIVIDIPEFGPVAPTEVDPVSKAIRAGAVWG